jgi:mono/diheme cytochrome c family protein
VYEPHLSNGAVQVTVDYLGHPAVEALDVLLGDSWTAPGATVEFRALDGYVSRVDASRFSRYSAYLVFARADGAPFAVDNPAQNEANVPLGPWYLVWDNISEPGLVAEGGRYWPYQVNEVRVANAAASALLPSGLDPSLRDAAKLTSTFCLSCHQLNGFGGHKYPIDLAEAAGRFDEDGFVTWVLQPSTVRPGTNMPALAPRLSEVERRRIALEIHAYLKALSELERP